MQLVLPIHVAAGGLALVLGAVALLAKKGGAIHRRSGLLFVCAMLAWGGLYLRDSRIRQLVPFRRSA